MNDRKIAAIFKALTDENRIRILRLLHNGERCACKLLAALNISQPTLSHHMKILCDSGLVNARKDGKWMYYSICPDGAQSTIAILQELLSVDLIPLDESSDTCC